LGGLFFMIDVMLARGFLVSANGAADGCLYIAVY